MTEEQKPVLPGERLAAARQEAGLSLEEAAKKLHLSNSYVKALEEDDYERLPEPLFIKGYIRAYARLLGLPDAPLTGQFEQIMAEEKKTAPPAEEREAASRAAHQRNKLWGAVIVVVLVALLVVVFAPEGEQTPATSDLADIKSPSQSAITLSSEREHGVGEDVARAGAGEQPIGPDDGELLNTSPTGEPRTQAQPERAPAIAFTFSGDCWLEVADATGNTLYQGLRQTGQSLSLEGEAPFDIRLGDPAVVQISLEGEPVSLSQYSAGQPVRLSLP